VIGSLIGGPVCDSHGRKSSVVFCGALFTLGGILLTVSMSFSMLLCGRFLIGAAIGWSGFSVTVYVTEVSPKHLRGTLVAVNELTLCAGCLLAFLCGWLLDTRWRWMFGLSVPVAAMLTIGSLWLPESPRWLVMQCRFEEALASLERVRGESGSHVAAELTQLRAAHEVGWQQMCGLVRIAGTVSDVHADGFQQSYRKQRFYSVVSSVQGAVPRLFQ
jgi:MFS family permease